LSTSVMSGPYLPSIFDIFPQDLISMISNRRDERRRVLRLDSDKFFFSFFLDSGSFSGRCSDFRNSWRTAGPFCFFVIPPLEVSFDQKTCEQTEASPPRLLLGLSFLTFSIFPETGSSTGLSFYVILSSRTLSQSSAFIFFT